MVGTNPISGVCTDAIAILDRSMGPRACGAVVSGRAVPGFRGMAGHESPYELTKRAIVLPLMREMGYGEPGYRLDDLEGYGGTVMAMVPMNRPVEDPIRQVLSFMRGHGTPRGLATDGFLWVLSDHGPFGPRVRGSADLRPYFVEALDLARFRAAVPVDASEAEMFLDRFGRRRYGQVRVLRDGGAGVHAVLHVPRVRAADRGEVRLRASLRSQTFPASDSTETAIPAMKSS